MPNPNPIIPGKRFSNLFLTADLYYLRLFIVCRATVRLLLHTNSAVNYFIYASRVKDFREAFRRDHALLHCQRRPIISHSSSATFTSYVGSFSNTEHIRMTMLRHGEMNGHTGSGRVVDSWLSTRTNYVFLTLVQNVYVQLQFNISSPTKLLSHSSTLVPECCKDDYQSQWEKMTFDPHHTKTPKPITI